MADVKWIKITTDIFDDEKILLIESLPDAYAIITVWFKLLCLAGKQNNSGVFMMGRLPYTDKMLATIFRMKESTVTMALQTFEQFGMIEIVGGVITIPNWDKHQSLDKFALAKEKTRQRVARHREKQKQLADGNTCNVTCNASVTPCNANRIEEDKDLELDVEGEEEKEDRIDIIDKIDKSASAPFIPNPMTQELIDCGYIGLDDIFIDQYNGIIQEVIDSYSFEIARSCLWYFIKRYKAQPTDEDGGEIENKVAYFRTAMLNGAQRLERDNNKQTCGVGSWLYQ